MMINPTCPIHGGIELRTEGQTCTCLRITFVVKDGMVISPLSGADWHRQLQIIRNWSATLYGRIDGQKEPVPDAFQKAFKDGELDV